MKTRLVHFLGRDVAELLSTEPFSGWHPVRSVENDPTPEVWYEFEENGVEVVCDGLDRIATIFLHRGGAGESLVDVPFGMGRGEVLARFGTPERSGGAVRIPGIGDRGAWDRFVIPEGVLHIQYATGADEIALVTLMRRDVAP